MLDLHHLLETARTGANGPSDAFLAAAETQLRLTDRPRYAVVHEFCDARGVRPMFNGEMTFSWIFHTDPALTSVREVADLLAAEDDWPALELSVPTAATVGALDARVADDHRHDALRISAGAVLEQPLTMAGGPA